MSNFMIYIGKERFSSIGFSFCEKKSSCPVPIGDECLMSYTEEDGVYTISLTQVTQRIARYYEEGRLCLGVSIFDAANLYGASCAGVSKVNKEYHPRCQVRYYKRLRELTNIEFDSNQIQIMDSVKLNKRLSLIDMHGDRLPDTVFIDFKFVLMTVRKDILDRMPDEGAVYDIKDTLRVVHSFAPYYGYEEIIKEV